MFFGNIYLRFGYIGYLFLMDDLYVLIF